MTTADRPDGDFHTRDERYRDAIDRFGQALERLATAYRQRRRQFVTLDALEAEPVSGERVLARKFNGGATYDR